VARRLGRRWIGIEREPVYIKIAQDRIDRVNVKPFEETMPEARERVPFKRLIADGLIAPGQPLLFRRDEDVMALVRPDGKLQYKDIHGSIHQIASMLAQAPCNGWQHWYFRDERGELKALDELRAAARAG
jgi:hypothetical protein